MININRLIIVLKRKPILSFFLIACFVFSSLGISIISSIISEEKKNLNIGNFGHSEEELRDYVLFLDDEKVLSNLNRDLVNLSDRYSLILSGQCKVGYHSINIQVNYENVKIPLVVPILKDNLPKDKQEKEIWLGKDINSRLGSESSITILEKKYDVARILGKDKTTTRFDNVVMIDHNAIEDKQLGLLERKDMLNLKVISKTKFTNQDEDYVKKFFSNNKGINLQPIHDNEKENSSISKATRNKSDQIILQVLLICIGIANVFITSTFWILDRKKEIAIRKAFGWKYIHIIKTLFFELFCISTFSSLLALLLQYLLSFILKPYIDFATSLSYANIIILIPASLLLSVLASVIPVFNALRTEISTCLKG